MKALCLVLLGLALTYANIFSHEDNVVVLTTSNFDQALQDFDYALVEFYAPWCGHCKRLTPEYAAAATQLLETHPNIKLCKVDATVEESLAEKFEIGGFPTLKFFRKGQSEPVDYNGGRTAGEIVNWLKKKTGAPTTEVNTVEEVDSNVNGNDAVALFLGATGTDNYNEFLAVANRFDDVVFLNSNNDDVRSRYEATGDAVVVFANNGEEKNTYTGPISAENVEKFVDAHRFPTVLPFNQNAAQRIFGEGLNALFLVISPNEQGKAAAEALKSVASELKDTIALSIGNIEEDMGGRLAEYLGISEEELPAIRIVEPSNDMRKFVLDGEITGESLKNFVNEFKRGSLQPYYKSEPIPAEPYDGNVRIVVGKNFEEIVRDSNKDVFIEYYAPWCGHCQSLAPIYEALAAKLRHIDNLVIAKMDAVANEVPSVSIEGFPTLRYYPKNNKDHPIEFEEERSEDGLLHFIFEHATVELTGVTKPDYQPSADQYGDEHDHHHEGHDHEGHDHHHHDTDL